MPRTSPAARVCVCGHDRTLHAYTATGLGACNGQDGKPLWTTATGRCACVRFYSRREVPGPTNGPRGGPGA